MTEIVLFGLPPSTYTRTAMLIMSTKGVPFRLQPADLHSQEHRSRHPFGRVPAMEHGEVRLFETLAIGTYVDATFDGPSLQPADPVGKARMLQWISAINNYIYDLVIRQCVAERFVKPMRGEAPDETAIAAALPMVGSQLSVLDEALSRDACLAGSQPSLADLFLAPILAYLAAMPEGREMLSRHAAIAAWQDRMIALPGFVGINRIG